MDFKDWIFTEGKYDWLTTQISRAIVNAIKNIAPKMYADKGELLYHGDAQYLRGLAITTPKPLLGLDEIKDLNILLTLIPSERMSVSGSYRPSRKLLRVDIIIDLSPRVFLVNMPQMIEMLKDTIRHELEHSGQKETDLDNVSDSQRDIWKSQQSIIAYYTHPTEIAAFVSGLYKRAKSTRTSFTQKLREYLALVAQKIERHNIPSGDIIKTIERLWLDYANKRFKIK
jgi:hypothetical protein